MRIKIVQEEAKASLGAVLPDLIAADNALKKLDRNDITEIRSFLKPHAAVILVLQAICILLGENTSWKEMKIVLMDNFLERLMKYEKNKIDERRLKRFRVLVRKPEFDPKFISKISVACRSLAKWCLAIDNYAKVYKVVQPKKLKLELMTKQLDAKMQQLMEKQAELNEIQQSLMKL